jgi:FlaA1/EpsC-like NDP-sugar epimerase
MEQLIDGRVTVSTVRAVAIEDLLGREAVHLETDAISSALRGRRVVVTGAGGSIGSELCRQICTFRPARLILVEQAENSLFHIHRELVAAYPEVEVVPCIADICDAPRVETIFQRERPSVLFHAAAHKHVPMMELNPGEAVKNNVFGTKNLADLAARHGIEKFVMISTDKAVNPTSVMGATKRVAELYVQALSQRSATQFITVRFGNVLGSAGSVVPLFQEMIARGGPVKVTHPDMTRYFMTIPEAAQLVVQAGTIGRGGEIFVLDMGQPVKIVDLARDLIKLSGRDGEIEIQFSGLRPGEKLFEEIALDDEHVDKTRHPKIFVGRLQSTPLEHVQRGLRTLEGLLDDGTPDEVRSALGGLVPELQSPQPERVRPSSPGEEQRPSLLN